MATNDFVEVIILRKTLSDFDDIDAIFSDFWLMPVDKNFDSATHESGLSKQQTKRNRGVRLSAQGTRRLQRAISRVEIDENKGKRLSAEKIGLRAGVSTATISRIWSARTGVDQRTLQLIFSAFDLDLTESDIQAIGAVAPSHQRAIETVTSTSVDSLVYPKGPIPLGSPLYIPRPPLEERARHEITQSGCVVRIKAPSGFGKSSLLLRVLATAEELGYEIASIDLKQVESNILESPSDFLRWFCRAIALKLNRNFNLEESWSDMLGHSLSTTLFLQEQILAPSPVPIVLNIEEFNRLFAYPATSRAFLPLLRSWYEEARHEAVWQKLRQIVSYATESYLPLDINQSPFNVGLPINLPEFTLTQVKTLADRHQMSLAIADCERLMALVGGHPSLIRIALYHLAQGDCTLDELMATAAFSNGVFHSYLQEMLIWIQSVPEQMARLESLVMSPNPIPLNPIAAYQLEAIGLIKATPAGWIIGLNLYRDYLRNALFPLSE